MKTGLEEWEGKFQGKFESWRFVRYLLVGAFKKLKTNFNLLLKRENKMLKKSLLFAVVAALFFSLNLTAPLSAEEAAQEAHSRADKLEDLYDESKEADRNTLAAPLLFSKSPAALPKLRGTSLLKEDYLLGYEGTIDYQMISGVGIRLNYGTLKEKTSFFLVFDKSMDLRNRWVRLVYTGLGAPPRLALEFDHDELRNDSKYYVYLDDSSRPESVLFKLPAKAAYSEIGSLRFVMEPEFAKDANADFLILDLEILPEESDPFGNFPESDLSRFDLFSEPFDADNELPVNAQKTF